MVLFNVWFREFCHVHYKCRCVIFTLWCIHYYKCNWKTNLDSVCQNDAKFQGQSCRWWSQCCPRRNLSYHDQWLIQTFVKSQYYQQQNKNWLCWRSQWVHSFRLCRSTQVGHCCFVLQKVIFQCFDHENTTLWQTDTEPNGRCALFVSIFHDF